MSTITNTIIQKITVRRIYNSTIDPTLSELQQHIIYETVAPNNFDLAKFDYNASRSVKDDICDPDNYPLKFVSRSRDEEVWISCTASGDQTENSLGTIEALRIMGFDITPEQKQAIFSQNILCMKLKK